VKGAIGKVQARKARKEVRGDEAQMPLACLFNFIYVMNKWFFKTVYFYFFSFIVIALPIITVLNQKL
jgi:hypothetical protein